MKNTLSVIKADIDYWWSHLHLSRDVSGRVRFRSPLVVLQDA